MKGISHFAVGIGTASCIPGVVESAAAGNPLFFLIAGICGLLPDTIDFKFHKFFYPVDIEIVPDPLKPDAKMIAGGIAEAVEKACSEKKSLILKLSTVRHSADEWQSYKIFFNVSEKKIEAEIGDIVDTGGNPVAKNYRKNKHSAIITGHDFTIDYEAVINVDIFDGPMIRIEPTGDKSVRIIFLPWHRTWSHGLILGVLIGLAVWSIFGWLAGLVALIAFVSHAMLDQLGFMGNSFLYPLIKKRNSGLKLAYSGESIPNLAAVWISCLVIFWNLYRAADDVEKIFNPLNMLFWGVLTPFVIYLLISKIISQSSDIRS